MASHMPLVLSLLLLPLPLLLYSTVRWLLSTRRPLNFPPGPAPLLGLGNLHQMPRTFPFLKADAWAKEYGPIVGLKFGPTNVVIINDALVIYEFIVKQGAAFSARPSKYIAQEHVIPEAKHTYSIFMRNDYAQQLRTISKPFLAGAGLFGLAPIQKAAGTRLVNNLLQSGDEWTDYILQWYAVARLYEGIDHLQPVIVM